ncbi:DUF5998 family protein [Cutibacterium avidum]|uniref:DUF5998 family protein n=1 Tax=Cutibacterium avidum TaxID=33010 RepID=UPI00254F3D10|nr:DUF5998 family protein [Cutibacterium avidum]MDK7698649.1 DUF5998 family protein [Cutibacterium avidum]
MNGRFDMSWRLLDRASSWDDGPVSQSVDQARTPLPAALAAEIQSCGFFPELVSDVAETSLAGEEILDHLLHLEAVFDNDEVHRHLTVILRTATRMLIGHTGERTEGGQLQAVTSSESIPLSEVSSVVLTRVVQHPDKFGKDPSAATVETWLQMTWGAVSRIELEPATCGDPMCTADHGYTGTFSGDDIVIRMSPAADGPDQVERMMGFATRMQVATGAAR